MALPDGIEGTTPGQICPHNVYYHKADLFDARDNAGDTLERLFRLVGAAKLGLLSESELDSFTVTELINTEGELKKQESDRIERDRERARQDAARNTE